VNILILEDNSLRQEFFKNKLSKFNTVIVDTVEKAKEEFLKQDFWDYLFLDHDLGGKEMISSYEGNTGYQFAKWLSPLLKEHTQVICHSLNPEGRDNIKSVLPQTTIIPFPYLVLNFVIK